MLHRTALAALAALLLLTACGQAVPDETALPAAARMLPEMTQDNAPEPEPLRNMKYLKSIEEADFNVYELYITVYPTYDEDEGEVITREAFEKHRSLIKTYNPTLNAHIWEGHPDDPSRKEERFGFDGLESNCTIRVRGNSSRGYAVKSYKIKLSQKGASLFGTDSLNLNKHIGDGSRSANKAAMDLLQQIEQGFVSLETKFVRLYFNDVNPDGTETGFQDQGLYTWVEQPNAEFLHNHGLDPAGSLYKPINFEFREYPDILLPEDDPLYDEDAFNEVIKTMANPNHDKLIEMVRAVSDYSRDYNEVFDHYFDEENYLTWMATTILLDNSDALVHNFLLYSPSQSDKWYFMPWDYDATLEYHEFEDWNKGFYQVFGINYFWSVPFHQRYFRIAGNVDKLINKMEELYDRYFTPEILAYHGDKCREVILKHLATDNEARMLIEFYKKRDSRQWVIIQNTDPMTDAFIPEALDLIDLRYETITINLKRCEENLQSPMGGYVWYPVFENEKWVFRWDAAFDLQQDRITYDFIIAHDPEFTDKIWEKKDLTIPEASISNLPEGVIYYRFIVSDEHGNLQYPLNTSIVRDEDGLAIERHYAMGRYVIEYD